MDINIDKALRRAESLGASYCDIRVADSCGTSLSFKDGELDKAVSSSDHGAGIRVLHEGNWGFYTVEGGQDILSGVELAVKLSRVLSDRKKGKVELAPVPVISDEIPLDVGIDPRDVDIMDKVEILQDLIALLDEFTGLNSVEVSLSDGVTRNRYWSSEGTRLSFEEASTLASAQLTARDEKGVVAYRMRHGGNGGYELMDHSLLSERAADAARSTLRLLEAGQAPSGKFTVIADPDLAGVFAHEAVGHAAEADLVLSGDSILRGRMGETVGSPHVTIFDDPTMEGGFGSFPYDDEGVRTRRKTLIENGVLREFLTNRETAAALGMVPNGSARAQSPGSAPLVRMSNTMIARGDLSFQELLEDIEFGIYLKGSRGGQVDTAKGMFQFNAEEGVLIEKGELTRPVKDVSLSGSTLETLRNIDALGDDFRFGSPGFCGKGQYVPVCDGGPHIRIKDATVGGG